MTQLPGPTLELTGAQILPTVKSYLSVTLLSNRGNIACRLYKDVPGSCGVLWLSGATGGWSSPAKNLYPRMARLLTNRGIVSLRLNYRKPGNLQECVLDALAGIAFLQHQGVDRVALIGHSFGGAVAIQAARVAPIVKCIVTLATQTSGAAAAIATVRDDCAILLMHGTADRALPASCSEALYRLAHEPKRIMLFPRAGHDLDEVSNEVYLAIGDWLDNYLLHRLSDGEQRGATM